MVIQYYTDQLLEPFKTVFEPFCVAKVQPTWDKALLRDLRFVKQYVMPPHDIISSMYNFSNGEIFFYVFAGVPGVARQKLKYVEFQDANC